MFHQSDRHEQEAVFWCSLLQPLILEEVPREEAGEQSSEGAGERRERGELVQNYAVQRAEFGTGADRQLSSL